MRQSILLTNRTLRVPPLSISLSHRYAMSTKTPPTDPSSPLNSTHPTPNLSTNYPPSLASQQLPPLLRSHGGKWDVSADGKGVERSFRFKGFGKAWEFMDAVAGECKRMKHHPEWSNVYNTTFIRWTTHEPPGLSERDVLMASYCDKQAERFGEVGVGVEFEGKGNEVGKELADRVAIEGGDCCVPKKKEG